MPPAILIKSDGAYLYATTDLATIKGRVERFNPDEIWYVTDIRQSLHFEQVFRAAKKASYQKKSQQLDADLQRLYSAFLSKCDQAGIRIQ